MRWCPRCGSGWDLSRDGCVHCGLTALDLMANQQLQSMNNQYNQLNQQLGMAQAQMQQGYAAQLQAQMGMLQQQAQAMANRNFNPNFDMMAQRSKYVTDCNNCRTEYDYRSFVACPSCGAPNPKQKKKMDEQGVYFVPELVEYEKRIAQINARKRETTPWGENKEKKGMFGLFIKRKELQMELERLQTDLDRNKKEEEMRIAEAVQKQRLATNEEVAKVKLKAEADVTKLKTEHETELTRIRGARAEEISGLKAEHAQHLAEVKAKAAEEMYEKLSAALTKLHSEGDKNTKFVQELALGLVQKTPKMLPTHAEVHLTGEAAEVLKD